MSCRTAARRPGGRLAAERLAGRRGSGVRRVLGMRLVLAGIGSGGSGAAGAWTAISTLATLVLVNGRLGSVWAWYREIGDFTLRAENRCRRAGSSPARTVRPMSPTRTGSAVTTLVAVTTASRAASSAMVKPQRSGSVPGRDSAASTITVRIAW